MRSIWKGSISFGLVNIPVALYPAIRREELKFRLLRKSDLSPINYKRVAEVDGEEVPWEDIVKGYEFEKGRFVVLKDDDFKRADVEATQTIDIMDFVELAEINPTFFDKPYHLEPQKAGGNAYVLLRDVLKSSGKVGIAKVVIRTRQHLAAVKPHNAGLMLELLHFADDLVDASSLKLPAESKPAVKSREFTMARKLVDELTVSWEATRYDDEYSTALLELIDEKIKDGGKSVPAKGRKAASGKMIDLVAILQESLKKADAGGKGGKSAKVRRTKSPRKKTSSKKKSTRKVA